MPSKEALFFLLLAVCIVLFSHIHLYRMCDFEMQMRCILCFSVCVPSDGVGTVM